MLLRPGICARALSFCARPRTPAIMPLRAKILSHSFSAQGKMSSSAPVPNANEVDDVVFHSSYGARIIELNRPKKYNALNESMVDKITPRLQEWSKSQLANIIVIKGAGKAFCAGGDVVILAEQNLTGPEGQKKSSGFFAKEYQLNHLISTYQKPYVAFMDGHTMGGGVGLSVHAPFRIATERTVFAMPETKIGFFPDVGGSFFLPRLDGELGTYLALTSKNLCGVHAYYAGIATHYIHSSSLADLEQRLSELTFSDHSSLQERWEIVDSTIEEFVTGLPENEPFVLSGATREAIDRCFHYDTIDDIVQALKKEGTEWAQTTINTIEERSPTSVHVTLRQMRYGKQWSIADAFQTENMIASRFMEHPDFTEGVITLLVKSKEDPELKPKWVPAPDANAVNEFFTPRGGETRLPLLTDEDYMKYPHAWIGLPTEEEIKQTLEKTKLFSSEFVRYFVDGRRGKVGVLEKVIDVMKRKTRTNESGYVEWVD